MDEDFLEIRDVFGFRGEELAQDVLSPNLE